MQPEQHSERAAAALTRLAASQMPTTKVESYRFTDIRPLLERTLVAPEAADDAAVAAAVERCAMPDAGAAVVVMVDGTFRADLSDLASLPDGAFVGPLADAPEGVRACYAQQSEERGGVFAQLNTAAASGCLAVHVEADVLCTAPVHVVHVSGGAAQEGSAAASTPRVLVRAESGAQVEVLEESVPAQQGGGGGRYFVNAVLEASIAEGATVKHRLVVTDAAGAFHVHSTFVTQDERSAYHLVEARLGGALTRCAQRVFERRAPHMRSACGTAGAWLQARRGRAAAGAAHAHGHEALSALH